VVVVVLHCNGLEGFCLLSVYDVGGVLLCSLRFLLYVALFLRVLGFTLCFMGWCDGVQSGDLIGAME